MVEKHNDRGEFGFLIFEDKRLFTIVGVGSKMSQTSMTFINNVAFIKMIIVFYLNMYKEKDNNNDLHFCLLNSKY